MIDNLIRARVPVRFTFRPLPEKQIVGKLRRIAEAEGRTVTDEALELIAQRAAGGMRDAESMLDQVVSSGIDTIDADAVRDLLGLADQESVDDFIAALVDGDALTGIRLLDRLEGDGRDLVAIADQVVARVREQLIEALARGSREPSRAQLLARTARKLAGLDINRGAAGGYRLQLELALLEAADSAGRIAPQASVAAAAVTAAVDVERASDQRRAGTSGSPPPAQERPVSAPATDASRDREPVVVAVTAEVAAVAVDPKPAAAGDARPASVGDSTPAAAGSALEALVSAWPSVVERIARNPANRPLIAACRPVEVDGATIVLGFPESQGFLRDIAERKRQMLEEGIGDVLGRAVAVRCVVNNIELVEPAAALAAGGQADDLVAHARRVFGDDLVDVAEVD